jgi:hypothetical protein
MRCAETKLKERQNQWTLTKVRLALHQECLLAVYQPSTNQYPYVIPKKNIMRKFFSRKNTQNVCITSLKKIEYRKCCSGLMYVHMYKEIDTFRFREPFLPNRKPMLD